MTKSQSFHIKVPFDVSLTFFCQNAILQNVKVVESIEVQTSQSNGETKNKLYFSLFCYLVNNTFCDILAVLVLSIFQYDDHPYVAINMLLSIQHIIFEDIITHWYDIKFMIHTIESIAYKLIASIVMFVSIAYIQFNIYI